MKNLPSYIMLLFFSFYTLSSCKSQSKPKVTKANNVTIKKINKNIKDSSIILFNTILRYEENNIDNYYKSEKKVKQYNNEISEIENRISELNKQIESLKTKRKKIENEKQNIKNKFEIAKNKLKLNANSITGEFVFKFKNKQYYVFIADPKIHTIETYLKDYTKKGYPNFLSIGNLYKYLKKTKKNILMITNGGMFTPQFKPEGLLIFKGKQVFPLDEGKEAPVNFYMKPNGVFFVGENELGILTTKEFSKKYPKTLKPLYATQSGPMLVINGKHHPRFNYGSPNLYVRSGVGILPNGNAVFIISKNSQSNFFDFATIFKDVFSCNNALFLDGAISKMYLKKNNPSEKNGRFATLISVTKK